MGCGAGAAANREALGRATVESVTVDNKAAPAKFAWQPGPLQITRLDGDEALGLCSLSLMLNPGQNAVLPSGESMGRQELQFRALELAGATKPWVLLCLCACLGAEEMVKTRGQGFVKREDLDKEAKRLVRRFGIRYLEIRKAARSQCTLSVIGNPSQTVSSVDLCKQLLSEDSHMAGLVHIYLALNLELSEAITLPDGVQQGGKDLALRAIALDPKSADAYYCLAMCIGDVDTVTTLPDGEALDRRQMCLRAIGFDPKHAGSYRYLGYLCSSEEYIQLPTGETMEKQKLYWKAIELEPSYEVAYNSLATTLQKGEAIQLPWGERLNKQNLYLKAIALEPAYARAYLNLAHCLEQGETIQVPTGERLSKRDLYLKAIERDPTYARAYSALGSTLHDCWSIQLPTGESANKLYLFLKAIELDPSAEQPYRNLSIELDRRRSCDSDVQYTRDWQDTSFRMWAVCGACGTPPDWFRIPPKIIGSGQTAVQEYVQDLAHQGIFWAAKAA